MDAIEALVGVPRVVVPDNLKSTVIARRTDDDRHHRAPIYVRPGFGLQSVDKVANTLLHEAGHLGRALLHDEHYTEEALARLAIFGSGATPGSSYTDAANNAESYENFAGGLP